MIIGILKEESPENRVALLPESVATLTKMMVTVMVEKDAGFRAFAADADYEAAGAKIASRAELIAQSDMLIKINQPSDDELAQIREKTVFLAVLNPFFNTDLIKTLAQKNITSFSLDVIPRTSRAQSMDILSSMATVSGYKAVLTAANSLPKFIPMFMTAAGTITQTGAVTVGGTSRLEAGANDITLTDAGNDFGGAVAVLPVKMTVRMRSSTISCSGP